MKTDVARVIVQGEEENKEGAKKRTRGVKNNKTHYDETRKDGPKRPKHK
jgi:hypothetical protein